jgi:hypothetical protein
MNIRAKIFGGETTAGEPLLPAKKRKGSSSESLQTVSVPRETRRATNDRGEDRHRLVGERAVVLHKRRKREVELINLSGGGAMVSATFPAKLWDRAELRLGQHGAVECTVRWVRDDRIGLEFAHETRLDWPSDEVATILREVISRSFPDLQFAAEQRAEPEPVCASDEPRTHEGRSAKRHPLIWSALLHHDYQTTKVRVRNLSRTGAMIESPASVRVGSEPLVELSDELSISATVLWAVGDQVGLKFHSPLEMSALASTHPAVASFNWSPPSYLSTTDKSDSDGSHWNRLSLHELRKELEGYLKH